MACEQWREMLSAQLDGEDDPGDRARVDDHLAGCAGCREWLDRAATVNRLTRTGLVADIPDLTGAIMAALGAAGGGVEGIKGDKSGAGEKVGLGVAGLGRVGDEGAREKAGRGGVQGEGGGRGREVAAWWREWRPRVMAGLYVALAAVGAVQLILGLAQIGGGASSLHAHSTDLAATPGHLFHESAAWNVAVGAAYLFLALRRSRPGGLVPMLTAFVGMLLLLSVNDLTAARVDAARLVSHGFVIVGYLIVVALSRVAGSSALPPGDRLVPGGGWHLVEERGEPEVAAPARLRLVRGGGPLTACHADCGCRREAA